MRNPTDLIYMAAGFLMHRKRLFGMGIAVFFLIVGISVMFRGGIGPPPRRTDLTVFLRAAEAIRSGEHIYLVSNARGWNYMYLPLFALILVPFTALPLLANTTLWYVFSVSAFFGIALLSSRILREHPSGMQTVVTAVIFSIGPLVETMTRGQIDVLIVFLAVAVLYLYMRDKHVWAGFILAFATVLKVSPLAPLFFLFLAKKEWKVCIAFCIGVLFFVLLLPSCCLGIGRNWFFLTEWNRIMSHAVSDLGHESHIWAQLATPFALDNQSLYAVLTRWVRPSEAALIMSGNFWIKWSVRGMGILSLSLLIFLCRGKKIKIGPEQLMLEYSLFSTLMILFSPVVSLHHYVVFYMLFLAVFSYAYKRPDCSFGHRHLTWGALIASVFCILGQASRRPFGAWGLPLIGAMIFWAISVLFLAKQILIKKRPEELFALHNQKKQCYQVENKDFLINLLRRKWGQLRDSAIPGCISKNFPPTFLQ